MGARSRRAAAGIGSTLPMLLACSGSLPTLEEHRQRAHIRVEAGDIADREYLLLGSVEWPAPGRAPRPHRRCNPDRLRARALEIYGDRVDAIVEFASWTEGRQSVCSGTAVQFTDTP